MKKFKGLLALALTFCLLLGSPSQAEFLKINNFTYISTDGRSYVIVAPSAAVESSRASGIFVATSKKPIMAQEFSPSKLVKGESLSAFITYNKSTNSYNQLSLANGNSYPISGSLTIKLDHVQVGISNDALSGPYISIISSAKGAKPTIIGIAATTVIFNISGNEAVALLEANKMQEQYRDVIKPYELNSQGKLTLNGKDYQGEKVGIFFESEHACVRQDTKLIDFATYQKQIQKTQAPTSQAGTESPEVESKTRAINDFLILNKFANSLICLDLKRGEFVSIKEEIVSVTEDESNKSFCVYSPLRLSQTNS